VQEATDKAEIESGQVYLAPSDYHLLVELGHFSLSTDAPEMYSRPSIDVAFESAAESYRDRVVGVVLTGANQDGSRGLRHLVDLGGGAIVQDPETAEVRVMPIAAMRAVPEAEVLPLSGIAARLRTLQPPRAPAREER
jgi:two-component system chemotaxis response regulator CheB